MRLAFFLKKTQPLQMVFKAAHTWQCFKLIPSPTFKFVRNKINRAPSSYYDGLKLLKIITKTLVCTHNSSYHTVPSLKLDLQPQAIEEL